MLCGMQTFTVLALTPVLGVTYQSIQTTSQQFSITLKTARWEQRGKSGWAVLRPESRRCGH